MRDEQQRLGFLFTAIVMMVAGSLFAFQPIPKESAKALGVTRGKAFSSGAVFVNGKYIEPPYVVERWGTGIRINAIPVTGQVIDWGEFVKTQPVEKAEKTDSSPAAAPTVAAPMVASGRVDVDVSSLDALFEDDPKPARNGAPKAAQPAPAVVAPPPKPTVSYVLTGDFVPNEATKKMLGRINASRTDIDRILRAGGFICFGDTYSQVTGDARTLRQMLAALPELMQKAEDAQSFSAKVREARLVFLHEVLRGDLYRNRLDYRKLKSLRKKIERDNELNEVLDGIVKPLL